MKLGKCFIALHFFFFFELIYCPRGLIVDVTNVLYYYSEAPMPDSSFLQLPHAPVRHTVRTPCVYSPTGSDTETSFWGTLH